MTAEKNPYSDIPKPILRMMLAVKRDDSNALTDALIAIKAEKLNLNHVLANMESALHIAVQHENTDIVNQLIEAGINVDLADDKGRTALHLASMNPSLASVKNVTLLQKGGADLNRQDTLGRTALHLSQSQHTTRFLLTKGANPSLFDVEGNSPLHYYAQRNSKDLLRSQFKAMVEHGCDPNCKNLRGRTILHESLAFLNLERASEFMHYGIEPNLRDMENNTLLHSIAHSDKLVGLFKELVSLGINPNAQNYNELTPLHIAAAQQNYIGVHELMGLGSIINMKDGNGHTPLHFTATHQNSDMLELLLAHGADVNVRNHEGNTILHQLCAHNHEPQSVRLLLEKGADVTIQNEDGLTPLQVSEQALQRYHGPLGQTIFDSVSEAYTRQTGREYVRDGQDLDSPSLAMQVEHTVDTLHQHGIM
ncbi:MAG: ankyrin repeat domain-containing protein [Gallionella sp.]